MIKDEAQKTCLLAISENFWPWEKHESSVSNFKVVWQSLKLSEIVINYNRAFPFISHFEKDPKMNTSRPRHVQIQLKLILQLPGITPFLLLSYLTKFIDIYFFKSSGDFANIALILITWVIYTVAKWDPMSSCRTH